MDKTPLEILKEARERIAVPERWCQGNEAERANGEYTSPHGPYAVAWCIVGALARSFNGFQKSKWDFLLDHIEAAAGEDITT